MKIFNETNNFISSASKLLAQTAQENSKDAIRSLEEVVSGPNQVYWWLIIYKVRELKLP